MCFSGHQIQVRSEDASGDAAINLGPDNCHWLFEVHLDPLGNSAINTTTSGTGAPSEVFVEGGNLPLNNPALLSVDTFWWGDKNNMTTTLAHSGICYQVLDQHMDIRVHLDYLIRFGCYDAIIP